MARNRVSQQNIAQSFTVPQAAFQLLAVHPGIIKSPNKHDAKENRTHQTRKHSSTAPRSVLCSCTHSIGFWLWTGVIMGTLTSLHLHRTIIKIVDTWTFYHQRALDALHAVNGLWFAPPQTTVGRFSKMQLRITLQALLFQQFGPCQIALRSLFLPISPAPIHY